MAITYKIDDEKLLEQIERLRGDIPAKEFVGRIIKAGLRVAGAEFQQIKAGKPLKFAAAKPEFKTLDVAAITNALKDKDPNHPVKLEVSRLVNDYMAQLADYAKDNGNNLPKSLRVSANAPIEKMAFQITVEGIKQASANGGKPAAN